MSTAADVLMENLVDWGVDVVFGFPGDGIDGIIESPRTHQKQATSEPGGINLLNGLAGPGRAPPDEDRQHDPGGPGQRKGLREPGVAMCMDRDQEHQDRLVDGELNHPSAGQPATEAPAARI